MRFHCLLLFLFLCLLTACNSFAKQQVTTTATAIQAFIPIASATFLTPTLSSTSTLTPTPTLTNTLTPEPTKTLIPSRTSTLTLAPIKTPRYNPGFFVTFGEAGNGSGPSIVFSPDSKMIALVGEKVSLWDINTQELIHDFAKPPYWPCYSGNESFNTEGSLLAVSTYCLSDLDVTGHLLT